MALRNAVQLICYPNRIGANLHDLSEMLDRHWSGAIGGVHILPPYPSNADSGFAPLTHRQIDPAYGDWDDIARLAARYDLCLDLAVNHISDASAEFQDFLRHGYASEYADLFVHVDRLGEITPDDMARIHIRKQKEPFREVSFANGERGRVWCTFTERQIDLDYSSAQTRALMEENVAFLAARGVKLLRLDAFGYITKQIGTRCFLVEPEVWRLLRWIDGVARQHGLECLPEVHDHSSYQYAIAKLGVRCYGFALPVLLLYSLLHADSTHLKAWLRMCPREMVTVLDTHDGICIPDVEGVLPHECIQAVIENVSQRSADPILRGSAANVHSVGAIYQVTCTYFDALKRDDDAYIAARAIQFFAPGIPQVYYVGLLAGSNDEALMERSGELRDINRHYYSLDEVEQAMQRPVVKRLKRLMEFRSSHPAFDGEFELESSSDDNVSIGWRNGEHHCHLLVELNSKEASIRYVDPKSGRELTVRC